MITARAAEPLPVGECVLQGWVTSTPELSARSQRMVVDVGGKLILVYCKATKVVLAGDRVRLSGSLENLTGMGAGRWRRRGITQAMHLTWSGDLEVIAPGESLPTLGSGWRNDMLRRLKQNIPRREAGVVMGIVAGQQSLVEQDIIDNMQRSGTLHLLAASGFNVLLVAAILMFLLSHLPFARWLQVLLSITLLVAYSDAVGARAPVLRATLMAGIFLGAFVFRRSSDVLSALGLAAIVYLLIEPSGVYDAGFQLSFATVAGLAVFLPPAFAKCEKFVVSRFRSAAGRFVARAVTMVLATTVVAQISSAPLTAAHFGTVSIAAPITNLLTAAAVPPLYAGACLAQVFQYISVPISRGLDVLLSGGMAGWIDSVNTWFGEKTWSAITLPPLHWGIVLALYLALLAFSRPHLRDVRAEHVEE